jgi:hypothetical protein
MSEISLSNLIGMICIKIRLSYNYFCFLLFYWNKIKKNKKRKIKQKNKIFSIYFIRETKNA